MSDFILRPAREADKNDILFNWTTAFGDCEEFAAEMLGACGLLRTALVAECDGKAVSCIFAFDGIRFGEKNISYLYALCTRPEYEGRGMGSALSKFAVEEAFRRGADTVCLQPGDEGLAKWYESLGFSRLYASSDVQIQINGQPEVPVTEISCAEYMSLRSSGTVFPENLLRAQETLFRYCGGAFVRVGPALLCVESDGYSLLIRDSNCDGQLLRYAAAAAACHFGMLRVWLRKKAPDSGEKVLMQISRGGSSSAGIEGFFLPFTLD